MRLKRSLIENIYQTSEKKNGALAPHRQEISELTQVLVFFCQLYIIYYSVLKQQLEIKKANWFHNYFSLSLDDICLQYNKGRTQLKFLLCRLRNLLERVFEKMVSNLSILEGIFEAKFQSWFFFEKNLQGFFYRNFLSKDFPCFFEKKFKGIFLQKNSVKRFPCKFTPWLVLHVLHFIGDFFYNPRASLARAAFKRDFLLVKSGFIRVNLREFPSKLSLIPAIDLLPPCLWWSEVKVKWKWKWKWIHFWSFIFFQFQIY